MKNPKEIGNEREENEVNTCENTLFLGIYVC